VVGPASGHWDQDVFFPAGKRLDGLSWRLADARAGEGSRRRAVMLGAMRASPSAAAWIA
jgi:hypothetical protein